MQRSFANYFQKSIINNAKAKQSARISVIDACTQLKHTDSKRPWSAYELVVVTKKEKGHIPLRGMVELPHDPRKTREVVLVFAEGADAKAAKEAGADIVGGEELVSDLLSGKQALPTKALAHPSLLPQVQKNLARMLGPKGLMPAEKRGTVTTELARAINEARGKVTWRGDRIGVVRLGVGRIQFDSNQVEENIKKFIDGLRNGLIIDTAPGQPRRLTTIEKIYLSSTQGRAYELKL